MSIFLTVSFVILNQPAAKTADEFPQFPYFWLRFVTNFLTIIHSKYNG